MLVGSFSQVAVDERRAGADERDQLADLSGDRAAIEQATGMVAAQLDAGIVEASQRLRRAAINTAFRLPSSPATSLLRRRRLG